MIFAVLAFMLVYGGTIVLLSMVLMLTDLDPVTAFSAAIASVHCLGPGLGSIGPTSSYATLTDFQIWVCTLGYVVGAVGDFELSCPFDSGILAQVRSTCVSGA